MRVIGERLMVHPTSATNTIDRLEGQGLVVRKPNPDDGRGKLAEITPQGRELVGRATDDLMRVEFGVSGFDAGQRQQLFDLLRMLRVDAGDFSPASAPAG
jgi:DNA-binding MarR family transcriptional regulator